MNATNTPKGPSFRQRLLGAILTSFLSLFLFFLSVPLFLGAALLWQIREPLGSIAMYGSYHALSGVVCLALNRFWLGGTWSTTVDTMIGPYLFVGAVPLAVGAMYLGLSRNPDGFIIYLYVLPVLGAMRPVSAALVVWLGSRVLRLRRAPPIPRAG